MLAVLMLTGLACNLLSAQEVEEIVEEIPVTEDPEPEPEEESSWSPELAYRSEHENDNLSIGGVAYTKMEH